MVLPLSAQAIIVGDWKLLLGESPQSIWQGPRYPNETTATQPPSEPLFADCGFETGCLYDLLADPGEHENVAADNPAVVRTLRALLEHANATVWAPARPPSSRACEVSLALRKDPRYEFGWWGPFVAPPV